MGYVESSNNPADLATHGLRRKDLAESHWLDGPQFLQNSEVQGSSFKDTTLSAEDPKVRKEVKSRATTICHRRQPH